MKRKFLIWFMLLAFSLSLFSGIAVFAAESEGTDYRIQGYDNNSGDYIIAKFNVKDFGAVGDGETDDTEAFTEAIRQANLQKGGVIYVPPGRYRITKPLAPSYRVSLEGHWNDPQLGTKGEQSILYVDIQADESINFLNVGPNCSTRNLVFYYPEQDAAQPKAYGYTINATGHSQTIENITFVNAYKGINVGNVNAGSAHFVHNIHGTVLNRGVTFNEDFEVTSLSNVFFSPSYWSEFDGTSRSAVIEACSDCLPIYMGKVDDQFFYNINIEDYERSVLIEENPNHTDPNTPAMGYGLFFRLNCEPMEIPQDDDFLPKRYQLDKIQGVDYYQHRFATDRYSTRAVLYNVKDFGAAGDGTADDTEAFRQALAKAGEEGGGVVFVPVGQYRLTQALTVPENVELRGEWNSPYMRSPSEILMAFGREEEDAALFTLSANSGIQGFTFKIPDLTWDNIVPYAWAIRGNGSDAWTEYNTFINLYRGIDFYTNRCDQFLIKGTWGTAVDVGIAVGGGSENGKMEFNFFTFGTWYEEIGRADNGALSTYTYANTTGYLFGDVKNVEAISQCIFGLMYGLRFEKQGDGQPENIQIIRSLLDSPKAYRNLYLGAGDNLAFIGVSTGNISPAGRLIYTDETFDGKARIYGQNIWGSVFNQLRNGDVEVYDENDTEVEILRMSFNFAHNRQAGGLPAWGIALITVGCVIVAGGAALAVVLVLRNKKQKTANT